MKELDKDLTTLKSRVATKEKTLLDYNQTSVNLNNTLETLIQTNPRMEAQMNEKLSKKESDSNNLLKELTNNCSQLEYMRSKTDEMIKSMDEMATGKQNMNKNIQKLSSDISDLK